jgi:hypothetical protein
MLDLSQAVISRLAIHRVGNKVQDEEAIVSTKLADVTPELETILVDFFTKPFKGEINYKFTHPTELEHNDIYTYAKAVFWDEKELYAQSVNILKHIHHNSTHPNIKSGEVFVVLFKNCILDDEPLEAIGIFKNEHKDTFLSFRNETDGLETDPLIGVSLKKLDKGCIIFNLEEDTGYRVLAVEASGKDSAYWFDDVLQIVEEADENTYTRDALYLCNTYGKEVLATSEGGKKDEVLFMKSTLDYFTKADTFEMGEFADHVINDEDYTAKFKEHCKKIEERLDRKLENDFEISKPMLKKQKTLFKNVIKLDTNIQIALNFDNLESGRKFIERGYDEKAKMSFYKVYFNEELG